MMTKRQKENVVQNIQSDIQKAIALFYTDIIGMKSNDANALRKELRHVGGKVVVTKNTLFAKAAKGTYVEESTKGLKGSTAMVFAFEDPAAVAKCFKKLQKTQESVSLQNGFLEKKALDVAQIQELADLPGKDQMLATLLASLMAPVSSFVRLLEEIRKEKEKNNPTPGEDKQPSENNKE